MEVSTLGMPDLIPSDVVAIHGLGKRFDSTYGVFEVTHRLGVSGYTTSMTLYSNTAAMLQTAIDAVGPPNPGAAVLGPCVDRSTGSPYVDNLMKELDFTRDSGAPAEPTVATRSVKAPRGSMKVTTVGGDKRAAGVYRK
jgi:hypothetical protein